MSKNVHRMARAFAQIEYALKLIETERKEGPEIRFESWFGEPEEDLKLGLKDLRAAARETANAISRGVPLPVGVDRDRLIEACMRVRQDPHFDVPSVRMVIDHAALVLADQAGRGPQPRRAKLDAGSTPPCPKGIGSDTHEKLWAAVPAGWFSTGDLGSKVQYSERTISKWCRAMRPRYLKHNKRDGRASRYRRVVA
ncbi:MAG: hypothetical protein ABIH26_13450 [Candidatus Eisenbacteria bacterium]